MTDLILIYPTQLFNITKYYKNLINNNNNNKTFFILIEDDYFFNKYNFHKIKLVLHKATMEYFYKQLIRLNYDVIYIEYQDINTLNKIIKKLKPQNIKIYDPIEKELIKKINEYKKSYNIEIIKSPMFLNSSNDNHEICNNINYIKHSTFYKL